jgi:hypothetical protein
MFGYNSDVGTATCGGARLADREIHEKMADGDSACP